MSKVKCKMRKISIYGENQLIISINEIIKEDELFILGEEVICNCTHHTNDICKSEQEKILASTDADLKVPEITVEDILWFGEQLQDEIEVDVEVNVSCCVRECMGHWCAACEIRSGFGKYIIIGKEAKIYKI